MSRKSAVPEALSPTYCLFSEFQTQVFRWLRVVPTGKNARRIALSCFMWAAAMLWLGDRLQANAVGLSFAVTAKLSNGVTTYITVDSIYGWMAQINEGPFYLIIGPILILMTHQFLLACGTSLQQLAESGRLLTTSQWPSEWNVELARRNRCCGIPLWTFPLFLFICLYTQLRSIDRTSQHYPTTRSKYGLSCFGVRTDWEEIGYIQSLNFPQWTADFNNTNRLEKVKALKQLGRLDSIGRLIFAKLDDSNMLDDATLKQYLDYHDGKAESIRCEDAVNSGVITVTAKPIWPQRGLNRWFGMKSYFDEVLTGRGAPKHSAPRASYVVWFKVFIILSQIQIAIFFTFMTWLLWKIVFWLVQIYWMLPSETSATGGRSRIEPQFVFDPVPDDPTKRYGLGALFRPYNILVRVVALGSSFSALHFPEGTGIRAITDADGAGNGATRIGHLFAIAVAITAVLIGPLWFYPLKLQRWAEANYLIAIRRKLAATKTAKERRELMSEEEAILSQSTWPKGDNNFRLTIVIVFAVLLLPLGTAFDFLPRDVTPFTRLPQLLRSSCKTIAVSLYDVGDQTSKK